MCVPGVDPLTLALTLGATTAGSLYNADTQNQAIDEQNKQNRIQMQRQQAAREVEAKRQLSMENEQAAAITKALFEAAPEKVAEAGEAVTADPDNPIVAAAEEYNVPTLQGQVKNEDVNDNIGSTVGKAMKRTRGMLESAASLSGQRDAMAKAVEALGRMGSEVQTIGSRRYGSSRLADIETAIPGVTVTRSGNPLGDLLIMGGKIGAGSLGYGIGEAGGVKPFEFGNIGSLFRQAKGA